MITISLLLGLGLSTSVAATESDGPRTLSVRSAEHVVPLVAWDPARRKLVVSGTARAPKGAAGSGEKLLFRLVVFERNLSSKVEAGKNSGKSLNHDFVVRELSPARKFELAKDGRGGTA